MLLGNRSLDESERREFQTILETIFRPDSFDMMLMHRLGWRRINISMANGFTKQIFDIIDYAEEHEVTKDLLDAALAERPNSQILGGFSQKFELSSVSIEVPFDQPYTDPLERRIREIDSQLNVVQWRTRLEQLERKICRIVIRSGVRIICGTGLLLGPDIVLTSYHIVREIIKGDIAYQNVTLSFDYKLEEDGQTPSKETTCYLHEDWLIDYCEFSPHDLHVTEHCVEVEESHLDYALLRLSEQVGEAQIKKDIFRGWIELPEQEYIFLPEAPLFILHHPYGDPLSLALNTHSVLEINAKQTRVRYRTSTEDGSSGAPCFNTNWDLIAIHQSGDPDFCRSPLYNQGIPIDAIIRLFRKRGKMKLFVKQHERVLVSTEECFSLFPLTDILPVRFDFPEEQMSETVQSLLLVLLKKTILSGQSKGNILSEPICINERTIECIAGVITPDQATSLVNGYVQVAYKNIEQVQQIFYHRGDIRIAQFTLARNVLENAALCLQRFCALLNHIADLPKMVLSDIRVSLCLRATKIIERCSQLCLDIKSVQEKDPSDREQRENFHERCREMLEWLKDIKERCGRNEG